MKPGIPWSVKGIEPEVREAAKSAAKRAGMTLGEWLNTVILDQNDQGHAKTPPEAGAADPAVKRDMRDWPARRPADALAGAERPRRDEGALRLEDIAQQLSELARRERKAAAIQPFEPPQARLNDQAAIERILDRIDHNERQTVEAFTAVNERLSVLGRQIAMAARPLAFDKPEDVPGFSALEAAIRNVVEHIEVSEKRTREGLKSMQDRLAEMAERSTRPSNPDDLLRAAPLFADLEGRVRDMASRIQRSESLLQSGLPDGVRKEISQLAERIEHVREASERQTREAGSRANEAARSELRDIEDRVLAALKEAQGLIGSQQSAASEVLRLKSEMGGLSRRVDDIRAGAASERDVHALRVAVEQLSTRVAQGPDMRPLAEMDRRLGELTRKLEQSTVTGRTLPQFGELEQRIAELDHRLAEAMRLQGDQQAITSLEQHIAEVNDRVGRAEQQLGNLETMERAIHQLYESLESNRSQIGQTAEEAANRAVERFMAAQGGAGGSAEIRAMEEGLRAVRESAAHAEQRNQETLEAVHETLEQIVNKLAELETASAGHQLAANLAQQAAAQHGHEGTPPAFFDPTGSFAQPGFSAPAAATRAVERESQPMADAPSEAEEEDQAAAGAGYQDASPSEAMAPAGTTEPDAAGDAAAGLTAGDDFIAAARRAAQAAATRQSTLRAEPQDGGPAAPRRKRGLSLPFRKRASKLPDPITFVDGKPVVDKKPAANGAPNIERTRKRLVLAGIVLLAAASAFAFNMLAKSKVNRQSSAIESPVMAPEGETARAKAAQGLMPWTVARPLAQADVAPANQEPVDALQTGSLPAPKSDSPRSVALSLAAAPGAETPPLEIGAPALREAAARGDAKAQFVVASRYIDGQGVRQDFLKAAYWYEQAAIRGLAPAQYRLGTLYERGRGVAQDAATALQWYERAAAGGNVKAMHNAAVLAAGSQAGTPDYDKAFKWFKAAADRGLHDSEFNLAVLYERGLGARIDKEEAFFWFSVAAKQGDGDAAKRADAIGGSLAPGRTQAIAARVRSWQPLATSEEGNTVAVTDPAWDQPAAQAASPAGLLQPEATAPMMLDSSEPANAIEEAQKLLTELGFNVGTPDGRMGSRTANAIRLFQLQSGLKVTGEVTPEVLDAMRAKAG
jgi:localization factor PodJL